MAAYYYLISSLPSLRTDQDMPFDYGTFLEMCRSAVSSSEYALLRDLNVNSCKGPLLKEWAKFYGVLAEEMTFQRNQKLGRPCEAPANRDSDAVRTVTAALNAKNPLEAENMLLSLEFEKLDSLVSMHYFDDYALNGYAMKLKLLERLRSFKKETGQQEFKRLFDGIRQQVLSI